MANIKKAKAAVKFLMEFIEEVEAEPEEEVVEDEVEEEPPPARKTKAAAKKRGRAAAVEEEEEPEVEPEEEDDVPTLNEIRNLAVKASKRATDGKEKVLAALQKHGSERLGEIDEENYPDLKEMLEKILEDDDYDPRVKAKKTAAKKRSSKTADF